MIFMVSPETFEWNS